WEAFHVVAGFSGQIPDTTWKWEVAYLWDRVTHFETQTGGVKVEDYETLLGTTDSSAFNPFSYTPVLGTASPVNPRSTIEALKAQANRKEEFITQGVDVNVGGNLFD